MLDKRVVTRNISSQPDGWSEENFIFVNEGEYVIVEVLSEDHDWAWVQDSQARQGWLPVDALSDRVQVATDCDTDDTTRQFEKESDDQSGVDYFLITGTEWITVKWYTEDRKRAWVRDSHGRQGWLPCRISDVHAPTVA